MRPTLLALWFAMLSSLIAFGGCSAATEDAPTNSEAFAVAATTPIERKVLLLVVDPLLASKGGVALTKDKGWDSPTPQTKAQQLADWLFQASGRRVTYKIVESTTSRSYPKKLDGFTYDETGYLAALSTPTHHDPDVADYVPLLGSINACAKLNAGTIDEVWLFGGPWMGFYESRLAGPGAFDFNSPPLGALSCNKLLPIMGFSYERGLAEMIHDFGHRTESVLTKVYGGWAQDSTTTSWNRFGLVAAQSPTLKVSGCGSVHLPPNAKSDYAYSDPSSTLSFCEDFAKYPGLGSPGAVAKPTSCTAWGCTDVGYYGFWFRHLPHFTGVGPDGRMNDWWPYLVDPNTALAKPSLPPPASSCSSYDRDVNGCNLRAGCAYYLCSDQCWPRGTPNASACPVSCNAHDGKVSECNAHSGCAYYNCSQRCLPRGTPTGSACPVDGCRAYDGNVQTCNAHAPSCAYYYCSNQCWSRGTPSSTACP